MAQTQAVPSNTYPPPCVCVYMCVTVHMHTCIPAGACIWRPDHTECPVQSLLILLEWGLLLSLAAGEPQQSFSPQPHPALGLQVLTALLGFSHGCWGLNSGMHACPVYALPFPSSQSSCMTLG